MFPLLLVVLAQASSPDPIAVVVSSKRPGAEAAAQKVASRMASALTAAGFHAPLEDAAAGKLLKKSKLTARDCQGASPCIAKLAGVLGPQALVIGVDVGRIGDSLAIHLEAATGDLISQGTADASAEVDFKSDQMQALEDFAKMLAQKLLAPTAAQTPPVPVAALPADAPKATNLEPAVTSNPSIVARHSEPSSVRKVLPWVAAGGAVAAAVVAGVFFGLGSKDKSAFDASVHNGVSGLPASELQAISSRGNGRFSIALSSAIVAAALGAGSAVLFATSE